jgi:hypothetical protein
MCPSSSYCHLCQYQNHRISETLQLCSNITYAIGIMLIDDNGGRQEMRAYDQFIYIVKRTRSMKFNR